MPPFAPASAPSFNLIDEPWIPCVEATGARVELSLRDTLARAHELREIDDDSPLVVASLHRLLLAILHRNFGPGSSKEWRALWDAGRFDAGALERYWEEWKDRFFLFHPTRPFYQTVDADTLQSAKEGKTITLAKFAEELASANNATLFDHSLDETPEGVSRARAARLLVAAQTFALGGGRPPKDAVIQLRLSDAPWARGAAILLRGRTLFLTLMLNLLVRDEARPIPSTLEEDAPSWEGTLRDPRKRDPEGYLDYLTWRSRRALLAPGETVRHTVTIQGDSLSDSEEVLAVEDPMMAFHKGAKKGFVPFRLEADRAVWRDAHTLLARWSEVQRSPRAVHQLAQMGMSWSDQDVALEVIGFDRDQAKVLLWRRERLPLHPAYLTDGKLTEVAETKDIEDRGGYIQRSLAHAEKTGEVLTKALKHLPSSTAAFSNYWASLESPFHLLFTTLPELGEVAFDQWKKTLRGAAENSLELAIASMSTSARNLRAGVEARAILRKGLNPKPGARPRPRKTPDATDADLEPQEHTP